MAVSELKERIDEWVWQRTTHPLAVMLVNSGIARRPRMLGWLCKVSPLLGVAVMMLGEMVRPDNVIVCYWNGCEDDVEDVLADISEMINRAPSPMGHDEYKIVVERMSRLPDDAPHRDWDWIDNSIPRRRVLEARQVFGDRWYDWKRGSGRQQARDALEQCLPCFDMPVMLVRMAVSGAALQHAQMSRR